MKEFSPKEQIAYIPSHVSEGYGSIEDIEYGFVVKKSSTGDYFCRYWNNELKKGKVELRTKANSELTPKEMLRSVHKVPQEEVEKAWKLYIEGES